MMQKDYILYLEDDEIDAIKFSSTLKNLDFRQEVVIKENGEEGLAWLNANRNWLPNFIVLDLNMPKMNGIEFLESIKQDPLFHKIPVIVFTTSNNKVDIHATFEQQIAGYMVKPFDHKDYKDIVQLIKDYWDKSALGHI